MSLAMLEIVQCSMMDPGCRDRALEALREVIGYSRAGESQRPSARG